MKPMSQQIKHTANRRAMSLNELAAFVQHALRSGADGTETVKAAITFSGKLKDVTVDLALPAHTGPADPGTAPAGG